MAAYVDGFVIPIKKSKVQSYKKMANLGCKLWMEHGAVFYMEAYGDDLNVPVGKSFSKMYKLKKDETLIFAFIVFSSKAARNKINAKVMKDSRMNMDIKRIPFDINRFSVGGFQVFCKNK